MPDILVVGSLNADLVARTARFPQPGETVRGEDLKIIPGGKGANQAVAAARGGAQVTMAGRVGSDSFGAFLLDRLRDDHVDTSHVIVDESATGTAVILVDAGGQNSIVLSAGANGQVAPRDVQALDVQARVLLLQLEIPLEAVVQAARWGRSRGMIVILNPAPARELPRELIACADYLLPNETELALLSGMPVTDLPSAEKAARRLCEGGAKCVIVTLGANGALIAGPGAAKHIPPFEVQAVDTTAAGDAFIGGFACTLLRGMDLEGSVRYANACGALAAARFGAQPSLPTKAEVQAFLALQAA
jgi:ribokinase